MLDVRIINKMEYSDKQDIKWIIAALMLSDYHNKEKALKEVIKWINNHDRGR